jgi:hypothetical protein
MMILRLDRALRLEAVDSLFLSSLDSVPAIRFQFALKLASLAQDGCKSEGLVALSLPRAKRVPSLHQSTPLPQKFTLTTHTTYHLRKTHKEHSHPTDKKLAALVGGLADRLAK